MNAPTDGTTTGRGAGADTATRISTGEALTPEDIATRRDEGLRANADTAAYALRLGDDALICSQRLGWWISRAPELEEDVALGNIALDLLGHARSLLTYAGTHAGPDGRVRTEDDLAHLRDEAEFRCCHLVELENGDFGRTIARQVAFSLYQQGLYGRLQDSADPMLAAIAAKAAKEVGYHVDHAWQWVLRLGLGTPESARRMQAGLDAVWPYLEELFADDELTDRLADAGVAVRPGELRDPVHAALGRLLAEAELDVPDVPSARTGGRHGVHREAFGPLLAEMQQLARRHPGATW